MHNTFLDLQLFQTQYFNYLIVPLPTMHSLDDISIEKDLLAKTKTEGGGVEGNMFPESWEAGEHT